MNNRVFMDDLLTCKGYQSLKMAVERDCQKDHGIFHPNGCEHCPTARPVDGWNPGRCFHNYCDKFVWVIERVMHYAEKTGVPARYILDCWEEQRDYWYMNFYQDCNQPKLEGDNVHVFGSVQDFREAAHGKGFKCPKCGQASSHPTECSRCDWKAYGLFGTLGRGATIFIKNKCVVSNIFMPVAWEVPVPFTQRENAPTSPR